MTAIAGIVENGKVWIGGDSAAVGGTSINTRSDPKVFRNGEFIFGYTSSFRMGQLLEHELTPPTPLEGEGGMAYMVRRFIPEIKRVLKAGGYDTAGSGGQFLVGYRGQLYEIESDYQVARLRVPFHACGCGQDLVLGSLFSTHRMGGMSPEDRIAVALDAAVEFSAGVRGPYHIESTETH